MKRVLTILAAGLGLAFIAPAVAEVAPTVPIVQSLAAEPAEAAWISVDYCDYSLRGGGSLAPDNDIQAMLNHYGAAYYYIWESRQIDANQTVIRYRVYGGAVGYSVIVTQWAGCYRWQYDSYVYHDTPNWGGWTY